MSRTLRLAGLVAALLWVQWVAALHGIEHLVDIDHDHEGVCVQCLALAGATPAPTMVVAAFFDVVPPMDVAIRVVPPRLTFAATTYFMNRAPPVRQG